MLNTETMPFGTEVVKLSDRSAAGRYETGDGLDAISSARWRLLAFAPLRAVGGLDGAVDTGEVGQFLLRQRREFLELSGGDEDPGVEGPHRGIVAIYRAIKAFTELLEMSADDCEAFVEFAAEIADGLGLRRNLFLPPAVGDGFEERDQSGRGRDDDVF